MTDPKSDTPRTDNLAVRRAYAIGRFDLAGCWKEMFDLARTLERENTALQQQMRDYEEVLADNRRLTRELDVALHGEEGAARQASLCDLIPLAERLRKQLAIANSKLKHYERASPDAYREVVDKLARVMEELRQRESLEQPHAD